MAGDFKDLNGNSTVRYAHRINLRDHLKRRLPGPVPFWGKRWPSREMRRALRGIDSGVSCVPDTLGRSAGFVPASLSCHRDRDSIVGDFRPLGRVLNLMHFQHFQRTFAAPSLHCVSRSSTSAINKKKDISGYKGKTKVRGCGSSLWRKRWRIWKSHHKRPSTLSLNV